jgi:hypothetical protein
MAGHTHVVDAKHKLIVKQQVTNQVVDMGLLAQTAEPAKEVLGVERIAVVADRGYFKIEDTFPTRSLRVGFGVEKRPRANSNSNHTLARRPRCERRLGRIRTRFAAGDQPQRRLPRVIRIRR